MFVEGINHYLHYEALNRCFRNKISNTSLLTYKRRVLLEVWLSVFEVVDEDGREAGGHADADVQQEQGQEPDELLEQCRLRPHLHLTDRSLLP